MNRNNRNIFTYIPSSKQTFVTTNSAVDPYFDVDLNSNGTKDESAEADALISYIRGNDTPSGFTGLRARMNTYLGDIMHANPIFVGSPSARYDLIYGDSSYWDFYWGNASREKVLYAAANDGMLHCFDAGNGQEQWAYIPYNLLSHLKWLAGSYSCHSYYVDLSANVWDIKLSTGWKSVLVGGMRFGGTPIGVDHDNNAGTANITLRSAMYALDVTSPNVGSVSVLWENNDERFGYTTSKPIPVKVGDTWYLVFGSGPRTTAGAVTTGDGYTTTDGHIFIVNPLTGGVLRDINLGAGNFFGPPVAIDYDLDYSVDMIYIGDAKGNLWRIKTFTISGTTKTYAANEQTWIIDVASDNPSAASPAPLISLGTDQPIVIKPAVTMDEKGRVWIFFGTGRYYCAGDNDYCGTGNVCPASGSCLASPAESVGPRSKYMAVGVYDRRWDSATSKFILQGSTLGTGNLDHRVIKAGTVVGSDTGETGYYIVDYTTGQIATDVSTNAKGWYFRLLEDKERSLGDYLVYQGTVFFISFKPDTTGACTNNGGLSNLYGVSYISGTSTAQSFFDLTGEGTINGDDLVRDAGSNDHGAALMRLGKGFAGGGLKIKQFELTGGGTATMGYTPLAEGGLPLNPAGDEYSTGVTSWREVWQ
jgi:type IV pilus assembly protein PilY1